MRQIISVVAGIFMTVVFTRLTSQTLYGNFQFVVSLFALYSFFSLPGLNTSIMQAAVKGYDGDYQEAVGVSYKWSLLGSLAIVLSGVYLYFVHDKTIGIACILGSLFFPYIYAFNVWDVFLQAKIKFNRTAQYSALITIVNLIVTATSVFYYRENLVIILVVYFASLGILNYSIYRLSSVYIHNNRRDEKTISYGIFLTKISVFGIIADNIDKVLIGIIISPASLALYTIGILFTKQIQQVAKSMFSLVSPKQIAHGFVSKKNYVLLTIIAIAVSILCLMTFDRIIPLLFGEKYQNAIYLSKISIVFFPFYIISIVYSNHFFFNYKKEILLKYSIFSPAIKIILIVTILPIWGINGLAFLYGFQYVMMILIYSTINHFSKTPALR